MKILPLLLAATTLAPAGPALSATTLSFQQGLNDYAGSADTNLREEEPGLAGGSVLEISIDASDGGVPAHGLLRFDGVFGNAADQVGPGNAIVSATLTLTVTSAGSGIRLHDMLAPWDEAAATWNSLGGGIQADGVEAAATPFLEVGANDGNSNIESGTLVLDVTQSLRRQYSGAVPGYGWALLPFMPDGTNGVDVYSKEWDTLAERPLLTVVTAPVPEPATALMALGGLALLAGRAARRR